MPWRLILFVLCLVLFAVFSVLNAGSRCTINYVIGKVEVDVVIALVVSFTAGVLVTLPFVFLRRIKAAKKSEQAKPAKLSRAEKQAAKRARSKHDEDVPELHAADDDLIKEKLGVESPRGKISLK
jgi:uncharacterized integral membrane protein